eukprot:CAMPEP_0198238800 /NCGR_PEP_ID=MMETSP1446-20131203/4356_1 /TAXON_ID=1461542 ORGANISM="Unidentified sp, Strain CCMP2111" /NCGR_SAMPLE_ID=MMETSP1446 /ASSEMBLY_ACC=CAM_ASM_001112 /LENGTH=45 /DNA_ID= /DNA_START= /DNA_END= /DNA_ORIENTATION=
MADQISADWTEWCSDKHAPPSPWSVLCSFDPNPSAGPSLQADADA